MPLRSENNIKLGAFVLGGLLFLVLLLYMIGMNRNLFGSNYLLKARFANVQGLVKGNNVRYSGIETGTVKAIKIIDDTTIEISMLIDKKMLAIIRRNAIVSIGTEGLVGNKVVNIVPAKQPGPVAEEGDILFSKKAVDTDEMLQTLYKTNNAAAVIAEDLKTTIQRLNNSNALWTLLNDKSIPTDLKASLANFRSATGKASNFAGALDSIISDIKNGKGTLGIILRDTAIAKNLNEAIIKIKSVGDEADSLSGEINKMVVSIRNDINNGKGTVNALLKDSLIVMKLNASLDNIQKGTDGFNQNMEALKHNFLLRGYFRKQERQKEKNSKATPVGAGN